MLKEILSNRIRQINVCCRGYRFTMATKISTTAFSITAVCIPSLNFVTVIILELSQLCPENFALISLNLVFKQQIRKLE